MKSKAFLLAAFAVAGSSLFARGQKPFTGVTDESETHIVKTLYAKGPTQPIDFEKAAAAAVPAVVHIMTTTKFKEADGQGMPGGSQEPQEQDQRASGSGVIISNNGYIVTNNHVVSGATSITVTLNNRKNYVATVVGADPNTDLALIKIDAQDLPVMAIGNSDDVVLGQWVLAIGYPLNLEVTVTQGIVSAKSRNIGINTQAAAPVESFIQTDAAVNPGSSGGALVNTTGELIAINSAIASTTGSFAGYAYAIPSNLMQKVISDILKYGSVQRGYLGISMAPEGLDDEKKKALGINDDVTGVLVMDVDPNGAAGEGGLQKGDVIVKINDEEVNADARLAELIATEKPGDNVKITFLRNGAEQNTEVVLKDKLGALPGVKAADAGSLGADLGDLSKEDADKLDLQGGVVVTNIRDGLLSAETDMRSGFIITNVGDIPVKSVEEFKSALGRQDSNFQLQGVYPDDGKVYYYGINDFKK